MKKILLFAAIAALVLASCSSKKSDGPAPTITLKGVTLVYIPAGSFTMGSSTFTDPVRDGDEEPHAVTLTKGFYLSECAISNAQYCVFLNEKSIGADGKLGSSTYSLITPHARGCTYTGTQWQPSSSTYSDYPVINVCWYGADAYCKWAAGETKGHLPTEAEWEYACRAGTTSAFNTGAKISSDYANYNGTSSSTYNLPGTYLGHTVPVKTYAANAWGLYQMHGNVCEWCSDWYDNYPTVAVFDPHGPNDPPNPSDPRRVLRGGGWGSGANYCRSAYRNVSYPDNRFDDFGFRLACSL